MKRQPWKKRASSPGRLSGRNVVAAGMTNTQAADYASRRPDSLAPFNVNLSGRQSALWPNASKWWGDLPNIHAAVGKFYAARNKKITRKPFADVVSVSFWRSKKPAGRHRDTWRICATV